MKNEIKTGRPKFSTWYTYDSNKYPGEINDEPSLTVPDMSHTLKDLIEKYTRQLDDYMLPGQYDDEDIEFNDPINSGKNFDLVDVETAKQELEEQMSWLDELRKQKLESNMGSRGVPPGTSSSTEEVKEPK